MFTESHVKTKDVLQDLDTGLCNNSFPGATRGTSAKKTFSLLDTLQTENNASY